MDIEFTATLTRKRVTGYRGLPHFPFAGEVDVVTQPRIGDAYYEASYENPPVLLHINYEYVIQFKSRGGWSQTHSHRWLGRPEFSYTKLNEPTQTVTGTDVLRGWKRWWKLLWTPDAVRMLDGQYKRWAERRDRMAEAYQQFLSDSYRVSDWLSRALRYNEVEESTNGDKLGRLSLASGELCLVLVDSALEEYSSFDRVNGRVNGEQFIGGDGFIADSEPVENYKVEVPVTVNISRLRCRLALALL